jgi:opacity protein-like surface antigen
LIPASRILQNQDLAPATIHCESCVQATFAEEFPMSFPRPRFALLALVSAIVLALTATQAHARLPKGDLYLGYSRLGSNTFEYSNGDGLNGLEAAAHLQTGRFLGYEADVSHYGYGASAGIPHTTTAMIGPRLTLRVPLVRVYAHALVGAAHSSADDHVGTSDFTFTDTQFAYALGGGVEAPIAPFFAWRVNGDYIGSANLDGQKYRVSTGLVFRF